MQKEGSHFGEIGDRVCPRANITMAVTVDCKVNLTADAVALYVTVSSSVRGRFNRNAVLLRPGVETTLAFLPWGVRPSNAAFQASLSVQGVNLGTVKSVKAA